VIVYRDAIFSPPFKAMIRDLRVEVLLTANQAPNMNAYAERFVRTINLECLDQVVFLGRESLVRAIRENGHAEFWRIGRSLVQESSIGP
jgi:hypothetical protein